MGIALRDQSGNLRRSEDPLSDVAEAFARIEDPADGVRLAFKLFDSEGVALPTGRRRCGGLSDGVRASVRCSPRLVGQRFSSGLFTKTGAVMRRLLEHQASGSLCRADFTSVFHMIAFASGVVTIRYFLYGRCR